MAIAFCAACDRIVYTSSRADDRCPVCSGPLVETEETIRRRIIHLETPPADTASVTDFPAHRTRAAEKAADEEAKEGTP